MNDETHELERDSMFTIIPSDAITEENFRDIADALLREQASHTSEYLSASLAQGCWSDDDTDYMRSALNTTEALMDIVYDGNRDDLVAFLYARRTHNLAEGETDPMRELTNRECLADMISAGGLCSSLYAYEELIYEAEEN